MFAKINGLFLVTYCSRAANLKATDQKYTRGGVNMHVELAASSLSQKRRVVDSCNPETNVSIFIKQTSGFLSLRSLLAYLYSPCQSLKSAECN